MLVAADTFRAAAADQLQGWAERSGAAMERPNSSKQRPDGVISMALDKAGFTSVPPEKLRFFDSCDNLNVSRQCVKFDRILMVS